VGLLEGGGGGGFFCLCGGGGGGVYSRCSGTLAVLSHTCDSQSTVRQLKSRELFFSGAEADEPPRSGLRHVFC